MGKLARNQNTSAREDPDEDEEHENSYAPIKMTEMNTTKNKTVM